MVWSDTWLIGLTLGLVLVVRFSVVYCLGNLMNLWRLKPFNAAQLFMVSFGGLRGAVSFAMALALTAKDNQQFSPGGGDYFKVAYPVMRVTMCVIIFTVFLQGGTVPTIIDRLKLKVEREGHPGTINSDVRPTYVSPMFQDDGSASEEIPNEHSDPTEITRAEKNRMFRWIRTLGRKKCQISRSRKAVQTSLLYSNLDWLAL